jgi:SAM-dependent methyltransferase
MSTTGAIQRTPAQLREHYDIERELADRLRSATKEERRTLYNVVYDERLQRIPHHPMLTRPRDPTARNSAVMRQMRLLSPFIRADTVFLEVGPGDCTLAMEVAKRTKKVYAVDVSDEGLVRDVVRPENIELSLSDGISVPVLPNSIDVAYSNQVMEHLHPEDAQEQLCNIYNTLVPGGLYICRTPNRLSGPWDISRYFDTVATGLHLKEYTITELAETLRLVGFSRVNAYIITPTGAVVSPTLPVFPFTWAELILENTPHFYRRKIANLLRPILIVAIK